MQNLGEIRTLDDLMTVLPAIRKTRRLNADTLRWLLDRQRGQCTWCGAPVGKGRSKWCSDQCVDAFKSRCCTQTQMRLVIQRDRGICQSCGRDTVASERAGKLAWQEAKFPLGIPWANRGPERDKIFAAYGWARGQWREVDHILPVVSGGGLRGIENLRLLCGECHQHETARLAASRKRKK